MGLGEWIFGAPDASKFSFDSQQYGMNDAAAQQKYAEDAAKWDQQFGSMSESVRRMLGVPARPTPPQGFTPSSFQLGNQYQQQYGLGGGMADQYQNRQINPELQAMLFAQANGSAPSAAQIQMQEGLRRGQAQALGSAFSNQNVAPAMAMRQALMAQNQMGLQTNSQMAALRAQEQAAGQQALSSYLLNQQAQNDNMVRYFQSLGYTADEAQMKANMALEGMKFGAFEGDQNRQMQNAQMQYQAAANEAAGKQRFFGTLLTAGGAGAASAFGKGNTPAATVPSNSQVGMDTPGGGYQVNNPNFVGY